MFATSEFPSEIPRTQTRNYSYTKPLGNIQTVRKGRDLELIIEKIEKLKLPNAVVKSPEFIKDIDTNTNREVDIGIRFSNNSKEEVFVAIECRDRKSTQDIIWIEQLITKKNSVQADVLIAVSSSTFTKPAIIKAEKNGVYLRIANSFSEEELQDFSNQTYLEFHDLINCEFLNCAFKTKNKVLGYQLVLMR